MTKRSKKRKKEEPAVEAEAGGPDDPDEDKLSGEERGGDDRRGKDRRKGGRRKGDFLRGIRRIGPAVWGFALVFYGGYSVWNEVGVEILPDRLPKLTTMRRQRPVNLPNSFTVQFPPFRVRMTIGGESAQAVITPFIQVDKQDEAEILCKSHTVIQFAIRQVLNRHFRGARGGDTDFQSLSGEMRAEINKMLAAQVVTGVQIFPWKPPQSGQATARAATRP